MRGKWTEGPWEWNERDAFDSNGDDQCCARISATTWEALARVVVRFDGDDEDYGEGVANAYLIAASPDLYEALEWLLASVEADPAKENHPGDREERLTLACGAARAALSLAHPQPKGEEA